MRNNHKGLLVVTIITIAAFTMLSACGCFAIMGRYLINTNLFIAGETVVEEVRSNSFAFILVLSICQICLLFTKKRWTRMAGIALAVVALLSTVAYKPLCDLSEQIIGGIVSSYCEVTILGYIAMVFSALTVFLQIYMLKSRQLDPDGLQLIEELGKMYDRENKNPGL